MSAAQRYVGRVVEVRADTFLLYEPDRSRYTRFQFGPEFRGLLMQFVHCPNRHVIVEGIPSETFVACMVRPAPVETF